VKNRTFVILLLCAGLSLPAFAQQTNSNSSAQPTASADQTAPASQPTTASGREPLPPPSRDNWWDGDEPGVAWLVLHPFASKDYVRRHVQPIQDRLNELDELTVSNRKMTGDVDARAQQGVRLASDKASLADQHALEAANKAELAHQTATALDARLAPVETKVGTIDQYKSGPQTEIRFRPGQTMLSKQAKDALDEVAAPVKGQHGYIIEVQGFSSGQGQAAIANSRKIADSVVRYLVLNHEIPAYRIYVIAMGNTPVAKGTSGTRVEISLLKNDLEQTAQQ
jgi:outer membrane protein OmpA-like peptidoglycan-associated protein